MLNVDRLLWIDVKEGTTYYKTEFNIRENVSLPREHQNHQSISILSQQTSYTQHDMLMITETETFLAVSYAYHCACPAFLSFKSTEHCATGFQSMEWIEKSLSYPFWELQLSISLVLLVIIPRTMFSSVSPLDSISSLNISIISVFRSHVQQCCNDWTALAS